MEFAWASDSKSIYFISNGSVNGPLGQQTGTAKLGYLFLIPIIYSNGVRRVKTSSPSYPFITFNGVSAAIYISCQTQKLFLSQEWAFEALGGFTRLRTGKPDFVNRTSETSEWIRYGSFPLARHQ